MSFIGLPFGVCSRSQNKILRHQCCRVRRFGCYATVDHPKEKDSSISYDGQDKVSRHTVWKQYLQEKGSPECHQCNGTGQILCPACEGKGYFVIELFNVTSSNQCQVCRGHRMAPCPTCKEYIYRAVKDWDTQNDVKSNPSSNV